LKYNGRISLLGSGKTSFSTLEFARLLQVIDEKLEVISPTTKRAESCRGPLSTAFDTYMLILFSFNFI